MKSRESLPAVWSHLEGRLHFVQQVSDTEWSSECIVCGGTIHPNGEWPDRMRIFADEKPVIWCRKCNLLQFPEQSSDYKPPTPLELARWRQERIKAEEERKRSAERALEHLRNSRIWEQYHKALNADGRAYWRGRGIPESLQNYWKLGWIDEYILQFRGNSYMGQSATIPIFGREWQPVNVKHRLLYTPEDAGKYRYELRGQPQPLYLCNPDLELGGQVYAIEGEIKAMVTWLTLDNRESAVVGLPGTNPSQQAVEQLADAERIILVMDPGAEDAAARLATALGTKRCRVLITPQKIDDAILAIKPTKRELNNLLRTARPMGGCTC